MNGNNKVVESIYKIKVNKKLLYKKSENNIKVIKTPSQKIKISPKYYLKQRNSFNKITKNLFNFDFDTNEKEKLSKNYSQRTYTDRYLTDVITYKKGNIIYDLQNNKYLKPIFDSKDFHKKILKCQLDEDDYKRSLSALNSPKLEENLFTINDTFNIKRQNKNKCNKNTLYLLNNLKEFNSKLPRQFFRNSLKISPMKSDFNNKSKEKLNLNNSHNFNSLNNYILKSERVSKTSKNFYNHKINNNKNDSLKSQNNKCKYKFKYSNKYSIKTNKILREKLSSFCYILENFFLNIIKKNFRKFLNIILNQSGKIYKINSETYNSRRNTFYDTETIKNSHIDDVTIKTNAITNINFFNIFETNKIIKNNANEFDRDIIGHSKSKEKHKKILFKKIDNKNKNSSETPLIYHKKINFSKNDLSSIKKNYYPIKQIKEINNNTFSFRSNNDKINNNIYKNKNKIFVHTNKIDEKKIFIHLKYYVIKDIRYKNIFNNKYNKKKLVKFNKNLNYFKNIDFTINDRDINIYKKIKINKSNNKKDKEYNKKLAINFDKNKKKYNKNYISLNFNLHNYSNNNNKIVLNNNCLAHNKRNKEYNLKSANQKTDIKINKILINCVKLLTKIITKVYLKKNFNIFKKAINFL